MFYEVIWLYIPVIMFILYVMVVEGLLNYYEERNSHTHNERRKEENAA